MKKQIVSLAVLALVSMSVQAQYYPYDPYQRHSVPANNYARSYNQGSTNAYIGMGYGGSAFMNGVIMSSPPPVIVAPQPLYGGPPPGTPYGIPYQAVPNYNTYGAPYDVPYAVPYVR